MSNTQNIDKSNTDKKRVDWNAIRAEYIAGGISHRILAEKHGVPYTTLARRAALEKWRKQRDEADRKAVEKLVQKASSAVASAAADNAVTVARIRAKLLARLEAEIDALPSRTGSNKKVMESNSERTRSTTTEFRLQELVESLTKLSADVAKGRAELLDNAADDPLTASIKEAIAGGGRENGA